MEIVVLNLKLAGKKVQKGRAAIPFIMQITGTAPFIR